MKKCLDTYALAEIAKGNKEFCMYLMAEFVITDLTLAEFYAVLLREDGEKTAEYWFKRLEAYAVPVSRQILKEAIAFRYQHRKQNISFFDAVGYVYALRNNLPFVTGDKEFEKKTNVEFRKAS
mgnify:CR=1 FL=1